jgi:excisionase family DNA binding protein
VVDLTVQQAAQRLGRAPSTLRTWIGTGDVFPTAYKLRHREWRIPASDLTAFLQRESERFRAPAEVDIPAATSDTSAWRQHLKKAS